MALKFNWKKNLPRIIWAIILVILGICLLKIAVWEHNYYSGMEGTTRATATTSTNAPINTEEDVDETDVTEQMKQAWKVAADKPRFLSIESLGIDRARVMEVSLNNEGRLLVPNNVFDVGWYKASGKAGEGGTILIDGHNGGPNVEGVFKHLDQLEIGAIITIERGDGKFFNYRVVENEEVALNEADSKMSKMLVSPESGKESLSLITCSGTWSWLQQTYLSRQFVRAVKVDENTNFTKTEIKNELQEKRDNNKEENEN